jgi:hypothetical protein
LSDGARRQPVTSGRTRQRRRGGQRGGRHGLARPAPPVQAGTPPAEGEATFLATPARARRGVPTTASHAVELTREQEFAYIRSDMRRLIAIAGGLLAVMLVLLVLANR